MPDIRNLFNNLNYKSFSTLELAINFIVGMCILSVFTAIIINFLNANSNEKVKTEKKSPVKTGTMTIFFIIFYLLLKFRIGVVDLKSAQVHYIIIGIGLGILILGCIFNIKGRMALGRNWGNQIRIYKDHTLIVKGVYKIVRHPLYASIIWMFYGASLIYLNLFAFAANTIVFIPFMYYRAKQEEEMLQEQFREYNKYKNSTGMFFPKLIRDR